MKILESVRDEDPAPVPGPHDIPPESDSAHRGLIRLLQLFQDANSAFLHVRTFLQARNLMNVSELDDESKQALIVYLEATLERMRARRP